VANGYNVKSGRKSVVNPTIKVLQGEARKSDGDRAGGPVGHGAGRVGAAAAEGEQDRVEVKVLTVAATVLLVPAPAPSPALLAALAAIDPGVKGRLQTSPHDSQGFTHQNHALDDSGRNIFGSIKVSGPGPGDVAVGAAAITGVRTPRHSDVSSGGGDGAEDAPPPAPSPPSPLPVLLPCDSNKGSSSIKIDPHSLEIIKSLGAGGFSRVFHVSCAARRKGLAREVREFALKVGPCKSKPYANRVESAWLQRLKLKYDELLSNFAFNFNLRRYIAVIPIKTLVTNRLEHTVRHERDIMGAGAYTRALFSST